MSEQQRMPDQVGWRESGEIALTLLYTFALTGRFCLAVFVRRNFGITAGDPYFLFALAFMLALACMDKVLWLVFLLWFGAWVCQRVITMQNHLKGNRQHSKFQGEPWLAMKLPNVKTMEEAEKIEPVMCALAGAVVFVIHEPLGLFIASGFVTFGLCMVLEKYMHNVRSQRMHDAQAEMEWDGREFRGR